MLHQRPVSLGPFLDHLVLVLTSDSNALGLASMDRDLVLMLHNHFAFNIGVEILIVCELFILDRF